MSNPMMGYSTGFPVAPGGYGYVMMPQGLMPPQGPMMPPGWGPMRPPTNSGRGQAPAPAKPSQSAASKPQPQVSFIRPKPFNSFIRQVNPDPPPTKLEFYWENIKNQGYPSYNRGLHRYLEMLKESPATTLGVAVVSVALAVMLTAFHRHSNKIQAAFILGLIGYPVQAAVRQLPKMEDAYEAVQQGNPKQGEEMFNKAMDEVTYRIGQVYLKPLSFALAIAALLKMPEGIRRIYRGEGVLSFLKPVLEAVGLTDTVKIMRPFDRVYQALSGFGDKVERVVTFKR